MAKFIVYLFLESFYFFWFIFILIFLIIFSDFLKNKHFIYLFIKLLISVVFFSLFIIYNYSFNSIFFNNVFFVNNFSLFMKFFLLILALCVLIVFLNNSVYDSDIFVELPFLFLISLEGSILMLSSNDFFIIYLSLELQSLAYYILVSIRRYSNVSMEAAIKYFVFSAFASALFLLGTSFLYVICGVTNIYDINFLFTNDFFDYYNLYIISSLFLILISIFIKLGVVPFHFWVVDTYEGAALYVVFIFSTMPKIVFFFVLYKFFILFDFNFFYLSFIILIVSLLSIFLPSIAGLYQIKFMRLVAYSSIIHMGFVLLIFSIFNYYLLISGFYYLFVYLIVLSNFFLVILSFRRVINFSFIKNINELSLVYFSSFFLTFLFILDLFSFIGLPPFLLFFSKNYIYFFLNISNNIFVLFLFIFFSVISSVFYLS